MCLFKTDLNQLITFNNKLYLKYNTSKHRNYYTVLNLKNNN